MKTKIKLYYAEDGLMLYARKWPDVPEVQISILKDMALMANFNRDMEPLLRNPCIVTNPDRAKAEIVWSEHRIEKGNFYEIECEFKIESNNGKYTLTIL